VSPTQKSLDQYTWLQISPHIQFLFDPGTSQGTDDLTVAGIRALVLF